MPWINVPSRGVRGFIGESPHASILRHPYLRAGATVFACGWSSTYVRVRRDHQIVSVTVTVAVGVNTDGRREVISAGIPLNQV